MDNDTSILLTAKRQLYTSESMDRAQALRGVIQATGVSQGELARRLRVSQTVVNDMCRGRRAPHPNRVPVICRALRVSPALFWLLGLEKKDCAGMRAEDIEALVALRDRMFARATGAR